MDPRLHIKTYHGLIQSGVLAPGFENEVFTLLFIALDNTLRNVEASYLITSAQLLESSTDIYNYTKGQIDKKDIILKFNGYPIQDPYIDKISEELMEYFLSDKSKLRQIFINSTEYKYDKIDAAVKTLGQYVGNNKKDRSQYNSLELIDGKSNGYVPVSDLI